MFKVLVVGAFAEKYIKRCLTTISFQENTDWEAQVVLDPVDGDKSYEEALKFQSDKIHVTKNDTRLYATANLLKAVELSNCDDEDILVLIDADDWLTHRYVFTIIQSYYERNPALLVTHGSWMSYPSMAEPNNNGSYTAEDFKKGIRKVDWRASHIRTMKYKVWRSIKDEDLRGPDGEYLRVSWDLAMMWPAIEMAGRTRVEYIPEILYVYNEETPHNDKKERLQEQMALTDYIAAKRPYEYRENF